MQLVWRCECQRPQINAQTMQASSLNPVICYRCSKQATGKLVTLYIQTCFEAYYNNIWYNSPQVSDAHLRSPSQSNLQAAAQGHLVSCNATSSGAATKTLEAAATYHVLTQLPRVAVALC
jgi:hypothetical protein